MGTHHFTVGYSNPVLIISAISHRIRLDLLFFFLCPFSHSERLFSRDVFVLPQYCIETYIIYIIWTCIRVNVLYYYPENRKYTLFLFSVSLTSLDLWRGAISSLMWARRADRWREGVGVGLYVYPVVWWPRPALTAPRIPHTYSHLL